MCPLRLLDRRADPELPGFVARGCHDAALAGFADGDRLAAEIWIVSLLDGRVEGIPCRRG